MRRKQRRGLIIVEDRRRCIMVEGYSKGRRSGGFIIEMEQGSRVAKVA